MDQEARQGFLRRPIKRYRKHSSRCKKSHFGMPMSTTLQPIEETNSANSGKSSKKLLST